MELFRSANDVDVKVVIPDPTEADHELSTVARGVRIAEIGPGGSLVLRNDQMGLMAAYGPSGWLRTTTDVVVDD